MENTFLRHALDSRPLLSCIAALGLVACGTTTRFTPLNPAPHPLQRRPAETVQVFSTALPAAPYTEFGLIQGSQSSEYSSDDMPEIIAQMRVKAGEIGCDGLILNGVANKSTVSTLGGNHHAEERTLEGYWATCIVFSAPAEVASAPAPVMVPPPAAAPAVTSAPVVVPPPAP